MRGEAKIPKGVHLIAAEAAAFEAIRSAVFTGVAVGEAQEAVAMVAKEWPISDIASSVILKAMRVVTDDPKPVRNPRRPRPRTTSEDLYHSTALAWKAWADGHRDKAIRELSDMRQRKTRGGIDTLGVSLEALALSWWVDAVNALCQEQIKDALRLWQRSLELGGSLGMEALPVIQWTQVATAYHEKQASKKPFSSPAALS